MSVLLLASPKLFWLWVAYVVALAGIVALQSIRNLRRPM